MKKVLKKYPLTNEEINMVEVFMLLYGYDSIKTLVGKPFEELRKHKDWNEEIAVCIEKIKANI